MYTALRAVLIAGCVGVLTACGGENEEQQAYESSPEAPERGQEAQQSRQGTSAAELQQDTGEKPEGQTQDAQGVAIPPTSAVEYKD